MSCSALSIRARRSTRRHAVAELGEYGIDRARGTRDDDGVVLDIELRRQLEGKLHRRRLDGELRLRDTACCGDPACWGLADRASFPQAIVAQAAASNAVRRTL